MTSIADAMEFIQSQNNSIMSSNTDSLEIIQFERDRFNKLNQAFIVLSQENELLRNRILMSESSDTDGSSTTLTRKRKCTIPQTKSKEKPFEFGIQVDNPFDLLADNMVAANNIPSSQNVQASAAPTVSGLFTRTAKPAPVATRQTQKENKPSSLRNLPSTSASQAPNQVRPKSQRPPPIVAYQLDHKQCIDRFPKVIGSSKFTFSRINSNCSRIQLESKDDYVKIKDLLSVENTAFHTYTPKDEKPTSVIIRHLCPSFDHNDIEGALNELNINIKIRSISPFETDYAKRNGKRLGLWLVQLEPQSDVAELMKTKVILHQTVKFERKQQNGTAQCFNCQHFGHTSKNCNRPYRCVKCIESHAPGECPLPEKRLQHAELPPMCVNCKGNHAANFKGCVAYQTHIRKSTQKPPTKSPLIELDRPLPVSATRQGISFAAVVGQSTPTKTQQPSVLDFLDKECNEYFGLDFNAILEQTTKFMPKYATLSNASKPMSLIQFIMSITPQSVP